MNGPGSIEAEATQRVGLMTSAEPTLFDVFEDETSQSATHSAGAAPQQLSEYVPHSDTYCTTTSALECEPGTANELHTAEQESSDPRPQWRVALLSQIEIHPLLPQLYVQRGIRFPPEWPSEFLTAKGIRQTWQNILKISIKTLQNRLSTHRQKA